MTRVFEQLIDQKIARILKLFLKKQEELYHISKISNASNVPLGSTFRIVQKLVAIELIDVITVGKIRLYKMAINQKTKELKKWL